jgi:uncharacterized protein (DUF2141 family)
MKHVLLAAVASTVLLLGAASVSAETTTTTTTWRDADGTVIREYSKEQHYQSVSDPDVDLTVGTVLPENISVYSLPSTIKVEDPDRYSYTIINDKPVVVERSTRKVVHIW